MRLSDTLLILGSIVLYAILNAQGYPPHQDWSIRPTGSEDSVRLTLTRAAEGSRWQNTIDLPVSRLRGLPRQMASRLSGPAKFTVAADAARLECEGTFHFGRGSGSFTFTPNPEFAAELERIGYSRPTAEESFSMMTSGVTLDYARALRDSGFASDTRTLIDLRNHGLGIDDVRGYRAAGEAGLSAKDILMLKNHGVDPEFLREVKRSGFQFSPRDLASLRNHGVDPELLAALKSAGYDLSAREICDLRSHGVSVDYLRELKSFGLKPEKGEITRLLSHGVSPGYLKDLKDAGYGSLSPNDVIQLRSHGVPGDFARDARAAGFRFSSNDLVHLVSHGVDTAYLRRLHDSGFGNLDARQIARLRQHGVD